MKVAIVSTEWYPVRTLQLPDAGFATEEVPDELVDRYNRMIVEFNAVQVLLGNDQQEATIGPKLVAMYWSLHPEDSL